MENNENFVAEQVTENVEQTTEQTPKMFSQEEVNDIVGKAKATTKAKIEKKLRKEYERDYGELMETLEAGTGKKGVKEVKETFRNYYTSKGIQMPQQPTYSDNDLAVLARAEADDIIRSGYEDVVEEVDRLTAIGYANMTAREKAVFKTLAEHRQGAERSRELAKLGVTEDVYNGKEFKDFASKFNASTPISDIYNIYAKTQPKKEHKTMGSMKNIDSGDSGVKDFYTPEEARKIPRSEYYKNPALQKAVENSMLRWKR